MIQYTTEQRSRGGIIAAANRRDKTMQRIDQCIEQYALQAENDGARLSMAKFFRDVFPSRNMHAMRFRYGRYVKGRLIEIFSNKCSAVNKMLEFCKIMRQAFMKRAATHGISAKLQQMIAIGRSIGSNPFKRSLHRFGASWDNSVKSWCISGNGVLQ